MNLKRNVFGLLAAGTLSIGMISGAAAADVTTSVTLSDRDKPTSCTVTGVATEEQSFGNYTWDGDEFVADTDAGTVTLAGNVNAVGFFDEDSAEEGDCVLQISGLNLTADSSSIDVGKITYGDPAVALSGSLANTGDGVGAFSIELTLNPFDDATSLDKHSGQVTLDASVSAP